MAAEYEGVDALMAALTDDPLPEEALTDADFMAEHWSAAADVALLREQLGLIGGALASQVRTEAEAEAESEAGAGAEAVRKPAPVSALVSAPVSESARVRVPVRERRYWRPLRALALGVVAVTAAGSLVTGSVWLMSQAGRGIDESSSSTVESGSDSGGGAEAGAKDGESAPHSLSGLGGPEYVACARLIVEGTVTAVEPLPGGSGDRVTLRVTRYYKLERGEAEAEIVFVTGREAVPRLRTGDRALIGFLAGSEVPDLRAVGEKRIAGERHWLAEALPESKGLTCDR